MYFSSKLVSEVPWKDTETPNDFEVTLVRRMSIWPLGVNAIRLMVKRISGGSGLMDLYGIVRFTTPAPEMALLAPISVVYW